MLIYPWGNRYLLATFAILAIHLSAGGQIFPTDNALTLYPGTYIHTEAWYTDASGVDVLIQNSFPKWGTPLLDSARRALGFSSLIFFNRIINEGNVPIEVTVDFPSDSFPSPVSSDAYLNVFLPADSMTISNEAAYSYGLTSLSSLFEGESAEAATLQRTIYPKQACTFYVVILFYAKEGRGFYQNASRAKLVLEGQNLFYKINQRDFKAIPCGQIMLKG